MKIIALPSELGAIRIADEVVSIIAGLAATEIEGVAGRAVYCRSELPRRWEKNFSKELKLKLVKKKLLLIFS